MKRTLSATRSPLLMLLLSLLSLFASRDAQAFYNPSTGRWLSREPINENGQLLLVHSTALQPAALIFPKVAARVPRRGARPIGLWDGESVARSNRSRPTGTDFSVYQFCSSDPLNRIDLDGRMDVPPVVTQYYVWQGGIGVLAALMDWYQVKKQCESLAEEPNKEAFGQTVLSRILTVANMPFIIAYCPRGGLIYRHIWFDDKCNCKKEFVIICNDVDHGA